MGASSTITRTTIVIIGSNMMRSLALVFAFSVAAFAHFDEPWFKQFKQTGGYNASDGTMNRLPLRLKSTESFIYGSADLAAVMADMEDEAFVPISVGGKAAVSIWFNNFTDTDCGGAYLETWFTVSVTPKDAPLTLPDEGPQSFAVADPRALVYLARVLCGDAPGNPGAAMKAITGGREIWGFPKHHVPAHIRYTYPDENTTQFDASHQGKPVISMRMALPENDPKSQTVPLDLKTPPGSCISGPKWLVKQTRYHQAFSTTEHIAMWNPATDSLKLYDDGYYGTKLKAWGFAPKMKVHATDFKIAAFKPDGWMESAVQEL